LQESRFLDARVNFVCLDYPNFLEHMDEFDGSTEETLEEGLEKYVSEIVNAKVEIDTDEGQIKLPQVLETYRADFGGTDQAILQFVFRYLETEYEIEAILQMVDNKNITVTFEA